MSTALSDESLPTEASASAPRTAIVSWKGKQYHLVEGRYTLMDLMTPEEDPASELRFDDVLMLQADGQTYIGQPTVPGASVQVKIIDTLQDRKVLVYKMRCKKGTRKKRGHRQWYSKVMVTAIQASPAA
jgi:large subunit ribosomal protein L21